MIERNAWNIGGRWKIELGSSGSGQGMLVGFSEYGNEPSEMRQCW
jgi:hypothetical protein